MKALALHRADRYQTVKDLQADIEAYQAGFATSAEHAGLGRLLLLFVKRHRTAALSAAAVVLALAVGLSVALVQWRKAVRAELAEAQQRRVAESARDQAITAEAKTQQAYVTLEQENYYNSITAADGMIAGLAFDRAEALLWKTPPQLRDWEWGHLLRRCQTDLLTLRGHTDRVNGVVFSPDGKRLYSASNDGTVRVWEVQSGKELAVLRKENPHTGFLSVAVSPDGRWLATGDDCSVATLWDMQTGAVVREFRGHKSWVACVAFSPDGRQLATAGMIDKTVKVWDVETGKEIRTLAGHESHVKAVCFSPNGRLLAAGSYDWTARIWSVETGHQEQVLQRQSRDLRMPVQTVAFSPDGRRLAVGDAYGSVTLYDVATGAETAAFAVPGASVSNLIAHLAALHRRDICTDGSSSRSGREPWRAGSPQPAARIRRSAPPDRSESSAV